MAILTRVGHVPPSEFEAMEYSEAIILRDIIEKEYFEELKTQFEFQGKAVQALMEGILLVAKVTAGRGGL
jgi:hypothetical protein